MNTTNRYFQTSLLLYGSVCIKKMADRVDQVVRSHNGHLGVGVMEREEENFLGGYVFSNLVLVLLQVGSLFKNSPGFMLLCTF